jgi:predicted phage tail protein
MLHRKPQMLNVFEQGEYHIIRGDEKGGIDLDASMLHMRIGPSRQIHILPAARGGGSNGAGLKIVLGAVMIAAAVATGGAALAGYGAAAGVFSSASLFQIAGTLAIMGVSMLLEGISRVIAPQPGLGASYLINGNLNTTQQGTPVPLVYGTARVGSVVIASAYSAEDYNTSTSDYQGQAAFTNASGGYSGTLDAFDTGNPLPSGASGKGSSKSSSGGGIEAPNTLESKAIVYLIDMISEGPIGGIVGGAQGIYFNGTPLQNANGSFNFRGVSWTYLFGTPDQTPPSGYPSAVEDATVGQQVFYQTPVVNQLVSSTATQARITIELPSLFATNTQNGDVNPSTLGLVIAVAEVTGSSVGAYSVVVNDTIHGKCTAAYQRSYVFDLPGSGTGGTTTTWNVRVSKATPESAVSTTVNTLYWSNTDLISNYQLMYPNSAMVCLKIDSEAFGSTIPTRSYLTSGIELQIPTNYNPVTGIYATSGPGTAGGAWDMASFSSGVSSNPAWILYDFLSNSRYGLGLSAQMLEVAREQLYPIAQYCDGLVPDGGGATERRYQLNGVFSQRTDAFKLMQAIAATFRGQVYWGAGQVCVTADMPTTPVKLYTAANVIDGNFVYNGTSLKTRHTTTNVHFSDPTNQYLPAVEVVELPPQVALRGVYAADILGFGVTSRGLAHRAGNWLLYTAPPSPPVRFSRWLTRPSPASAWAVDCARPQRSTCWRWTWCSARWPAPPTRSLSFCKTDR